MHGLQNDFVVLDKRGEAASNFPKLDEKTIRHIAHRKYGVGCDQLIVIENPRDKAADIFMRIYNSDGSEVSACGNATRCVAGEIMREKEKTHIVIETMAGLLDCDDKGNGKVAVDMGAAKLDWREIPLKDAADTNSVDLKMFDLPPASCASMGNPHAVFFVDDLQKIDIAAIGPALERHAQFPERCNIEFAQILNPRQIRMRVWERGAGITSACGTGACATLVAAVRRNLIPERKAEIILDGGSLDIEWLRDGHVIMTGAWERSFIGIVDIK